MFLNKKIKKYLVYTLVTLSFAGSKQSHTQSPPGTGQQHTVTLTKDDLLYFDTKNFLSDPKKVFEQLIKDGFEECSFKTPDNYTIHGLYLERPNAKCTIICCSGFLPGIKEGLAPFAKIMKNYNVLIFDGRGKITGKSDGKILWDTMPFSTNEYQDIIGAIEFINAKNNDLIYIWAVCAGAHHSYHAIAELTQKNLIKKYNICGRTLDSIPPSLTNISGTAPYAFAEEILMSKCKKTYDTKDKGIIRQKRGFKIASGSLYGLWKAIHTGFVQWLFKWNEKTTNLHNKAHATEIPTLFIHSYDDTYVDIADVQSLCDKTKNAEAWWIDTPSKHACHHLKYKEEYTQRVNEHIEKCIADYKKKQ